MAKMARLPAIDVLRGFVIALMALDHARDFFGPAPFNAEDLAATTPAWFWTRWITHLCATVFVLLAGSSAFLRGQGSGIPNLSRYLATRGAMLIALEMTWISFSWQFGFHVFIMQVIWALGAGMLFLALMVRLPRPAIIGVAAVLILSHNLFDDLKLDNPLWRAFHQGGFVPFDATHGIVFMYPLMPWLGLITAGYALGPVFLWEKERRQRFLLAAAGALMLLFVVLRAGNYYGDPEPWSLQNKDVMFDLMSFMRVHKYPPSLLYLCVTGSIGLALLVLFERIKPPPLFALFGAHPLFFYVIHIALTHLLGIVCLQLMYGGQPGNGNAGFQSPGGYQPSLLLVYVAWLGVLAVMTTLTQAWVRYNQAKRAHLPA